MLKRTLMRGNHLIRMALFKQAFFVRLAFGVEVVADAAVQSYCEWATLMLRTILHRYVKPGQSILDLGTGAHALIAIYITKLCPEAKVLATEIVPERVGWARRTIERNGAKVECLEADLFEGIPHRFDLVLLTPPAIPSADLLALGYKPQPLPGHQARYCWSGDGGGDGLDVLRPFISEVSAHLKPEGRAIVCVNPAHCPATKIGELCGSAGLSVEREHRFPGVMHAYVIADKRLTPAAEQARI